MPRNSTLSGLSWSIGNKLASALFQILVLALASRILERDEYGSFLILSSVMLSLAIISRCGVHQTGMRNISYALGRGDPAKARTTVLKASRAATLCAAAFCLLLPAGFVLFLPSSAGVLQYSIEVLVLVLLWAFFVALENAFAEFLRGFGCFRASAFVSGTVRLGVYASTLSILLYAAPAADLKMLIGIAVGCSMLGALIGGSILLSVLPTRPALGGERPIDEPLLGVAGVIWISSSVSYLFLQIDVIILSFFVPDEEIAVYGSAVRLSALIALLFHASNLYVPATIARLHASGREEHLQSTVRSITAVVSIPAVLLFLFVVIIGDELLRVVFGDGFENGYEILVVAAAYQVVNCLLGPTTMILNMTGNQKSGVIVALMSLAVFVVPMVILVPVFGTVAAAYCLLFGGTVGKVLGVVLVRRNTGIWSFADFRVGQMKLLLSGH